MHTNPAMDNQNTQRSKLPCLATAQGLPTAQIPDAINWPATLPGIPLRRSEWAREGCSRIPSMASLDTVGGIFFFIKNKE
jgi:hypothetical protein